MGTYQDVPKQSASLIEIAIGIALQAHMGQKDKAGAVYILHPLRVMLRMRTELEMVAAVLHDVVEDSSTTLETLRVQGIPEEALSAIDGLTRQQGESYDAFIQRAKQHPVAAKIKRADLEDNMDLTRIADRTGKDLARMEKYRKAWQELTDCNECKGYF